MMVLMGLACEDGNESATEVGGEDVVWDVAEPMADTTTDIIADVGEAPDMAEELNENEVTLVTSMGEITILLKPEEAPMTTANFMAYVEEGFYDGDDGLGGTTFHRVIVNFMVQGGGFTVDGSKKATHPPIVNEADNGLPNIRGSVAMARTSDPHSATSQFFINHVNNPFLDYVSASEPGYAVFAEVIAGMEVVDAIANVATGAEDVPVQPVVIQDVVW